MYKSVIFLIVIFPGITEPVPESKLPNEWGFYGHELIIRHAIFTLPYELRKFYKTHLNRLEDLSTLPDKRRYTLKDEGPRHFLDFDRYDSSLLFPQPVPWDTLLKYTTESFRHAAGILPWNLKRLKYRLINAFQAQHVKDIQRLSAEVAHYVSDSQVPLHTCSNYNGQETNQVGIHGLWESRLVELYFTDYEPFIGKSTFRQSLLEDIWKQMIYTSGLSIKVLETERAVSLFFPEGKKYAWTERKSRIIRTYSESFCEVYLHSLDDMVEEQLRTSIELTGDFWYTCWVEAGMPKFPE